MFTLLQDFSLWTYNSPGLYMLLVGSLILFLMAVAFQKSVHALVQAYREEATLIKIGVDFIRPVSELIRPKTESSERACRQLLSSAGFTSEHALETLFFIKSVLLVASLLIGMMLYAILPFQSVVMLVGVLFFIALKGPEVHLNGLAKERKRRFRRAVNAFIDLMVLCLDVGLSLESAFERVAREIRKLEPLFYIEAEIMSAEVGAGVTFTQALARMAERMDVEEMTQVVRVIIQAASLGASVGKNLREYADALNHRKIEKAEEQAGKIATLMSLPMGMCLLPACMVVLLGPTIVKAMFIE